METNTETQVIICPQCQRGLRALKTPHCPWCGTPIAEQDFAAVAVTSPRREAVDLPPLISYNTQPGVWQSPYGQVKQRPRQRWEIKFRKFFAVMFGVFLVVRLCDMIYTWYLVHRLIGQMAH